MEDWNMDRDFFAKLAVLKRQSPRQFAVIQGYIGRLLEQNREVDKASLKHEPAPQVDRCHG